MWGDSILPQFHSFAAGDDEEGFLFLLVGAFKNDVIPLW